MTAEGRPEAAAELGWLPVGDALLRGVGHALNNRVAALSAVVQVLVSSGSGGPLEQALTQETERLQRSVELLRALPRRWEGEPEPAMVQDSVRDALELLPLHYDLPELLYHWDGAPDLAPVLVEPSLLTHLLCLMGARAARAAARAGTTVVRFRGTGTADAVTVEVGPEGDGTMAVADDGVEATEVASARALAERAGGELRAGGSGAAYRVACTLPTLAAARRREGRG